MNVRAHYSKGEWDLEARKGIPTTIEGNGTDRIEGAGIVYLEDIIPYPPCVDGKGRVLFDDDVLTIEEYSEGIINVYCPKYDDEFYYVFENAVVDIDVEIVTNSSHTQSWLEATPVYGNVYIKPYGIYYRALNPTTNRPGINFDAASLSSGLQVHKVALDLRNRTSGYNGAKYTLCGANEWENLYGTDMPKASLFTYAEKDLYFAKVNKHFHYAQVINKTTLPSMYFEQFD